MREGGRKFVSPYQKSVMKIKLTFLVCGLTVVCAVAQTGQAGPGTNEQVTKHAAPASKPGAARRVQVDEFEKLWRDKRNVVLDVRTKKEFDAGRIPGAKNLDVNGTDFDRQLAELGKNKTYLVHCAAGVRSAKACARMSGLGFTNLIDLAPGFQGWQKAGKPVEK